MAAAAATAGHRRWLALLAATVTTLVAVAAIWLDAEPREIVCPAIEGCTAEARRTAAVAWTVVLVVAYLLSAALHMVRPRWRVAGPTLLGLVVVGLVAYQAVLESTGYILW